MLLKTDAHPPAALEPSDWVRRWSGLVKPGGHVLDLACGSGRHLTWLAARGFAVTGVDRDEVAVRPLARLGEVVVADLESGPWPLEGRRFDAVVVTNYLWRPLWPRILDAVEDGGCLIYETFRSGHEQIGRPSRADFLLEPGELWRVCEGLRVVAFEDGELTGPHRRVQRICALRGQAAEPADSWPALFPAVGG
jgi:SAM-dependent methyltransferase